MNCAWLVCPSRNAFCPLLPCCCVSSCAGPLQRHAPNASVWEDAFSAVDQGLECEDGCTATAALAWQVSLTTSVLMKWRSTRLMLLCVNIVQVVASALKQQLVTDVSQSGGCAGAVDEHHRS